MAVYLFRSFPKKRLKKKKKRLMLFLTEGKECQIVICQDRKSLIYRLPKERKKGKSLWSKYRQYLTKTFLAQQSEQFIIRREQIIIQYKKLFCTEINESIPFFSQFDLMLFCRPTCIVLDSFSISQHSFFASKVFFPFKHLLFHPSNFSFY